MGFSVLLVLLLEVKRCRILEEVDLARLLPPGLVGDDGAPPMDEWLLPSPAGAVDANGYFLGDDFGEAGALDASCKEAFESGG